ncbi:MAG: DUF2784 domain-containing protein [Rhodocyclaceae bacterium]|nr:DUF2784 domain-containing protein [Rhodocyclaceae bacterium]
MPPALWSLLADAVVLVHGMFVAFVVAGGLLALRWRRAPWLHLPAAAWGFAVQANGWICPLTPLENRLRALSGDAPYPGDFLGRWLLAALYPEGLTPQVQAWLAALVVAANVAAYGFVVARRRRGRRRR